MADDVYDEGPDGPDEEDRPQRPSGDGVRIVGAEEARAAYEEGREPRPGGRPAPRRPAPEPPPAPFPRSGDPGPGARPGLFGDAADEWTEESPRVRGQIFGEPPGTEPDVSEDRPTGSVELPHWTEPPTGETFAMSSRGDEPSPTGPRFRDVDQDWGDEDSVGDLMGEGDDEPMVPVRPEIPVDDDESFARDVEERRRAVRAAREAGVRPPVPGGARTMPSTGPATGPSTEPSTGPTPGVPGGASERGRTRPGVPGEGMLEPGMPEPPPLAPRHDERDLPMAIVLGVAMGVAALLMFNLGRGWTAGLVALIATMAAAELYAALRARGYRPATPVGLAACAGLVLAAYDRGYEAFPLVMALAGITSLLWFLIRAEEQARPVANLGMTVLPVAYVGVLAGFGGLILGFPNGIGILLGAVIPTVAHDVMGFAVGSRLGTHRIAPEVSPNKTAEGLIGAVLGAIVAALIFVRPIHPWSTGSAFWLGVVVAVMAPIGDLVESMLKRDIGVKDFSSLIPGHGGLLDRFDSILFVLPGVFYLVRILDLF